MVTTFVHEQTQILVVEDDIEVAELVCEQLEAAGFPTFWAQRGEDAISILENQRAGLVLLDLSLPDVDGFDLLYKVRAQSPIPIIVISGYSQNTDKVRAFEAGADDFISKPYASSILIARIKALIRRVGIPTNVETRLSVGPIEIDITRRQTFLRGKKLHLTPTEYSILVTLMRNTGQVVSHNELMQNVWGDQYGADFSVLRVNISRLRTKLGDSSRQPRLILTIPGGGYTLTTGR